MLRLSLSLIVLLTTMLYFPLAFSADMEPEWAEKVLASFESDTQTGHTSYRIGEWNEKDQYWSVLKNDDIVGYAFQTNKQVMIPAYSGKPVNTLVAIDTRGVIKTAWVLSHHEPILLVGIPEQKLWDFAQQYEGKTIVDNIRIGASQESGAISVDAVTGATVTVMIVHEGILRSAKKVARAVGILQSDSANQQPAAKVNMDFFNPADWLTLNGNGSIRRLLLDKGSVQTAFTGTEAEFVDAPSPQHEGDIFIDLYYTYLNAPSIGKNLLGESEFQWLMQELNPGDHAIAVMALGEYSFKGSGYVRGGIFDRLQLAQKGNALSFRDVDYYRLNDMYLQGAPGLKEMAIFIIRDQYQFDPGSPWKLELLVRRQIGPIKSTFASFSADYQLPQEYLIPPDPIIAAPDDDVPIWIALWKARAFPIAVVTISLILLTTIIFFQDWLVRYPRFLHNLRRLFLLYTVFFIGWYALGQLSIVNVFTFSHALMGDFRWELFLMDPVIFILWGFTAATIVLWGRGIFCGWLCPFGALQELINELARKLKIRQIELPFWLHERLWAVKYLILLALFAVSLESISTAERYAEIEPFKTTILLAFQREWWFVTYALGLLFVSIFTRKVYCRYLCPLGAALAIPTKLRLFDWLKRRKECGDPCQLCAVECEIQAIHPDGTINANECHHCLDCQMTYHNDKKCPPLINKAKKRNKVHRESKKDPNIIEAVNV